MFGSLVQRLQSLSPLGSPVTSPVSSPKARRRYKSPTRGPRRPPLGRHKEEYREVQSDPELDEIETTKKLGRASRHLLDKRKNKSRAARNSNNTESGINNNTYNEHTGFAPLQGSKSLGRLDGLKEVRFNSYNTIIIIAIGKKPIFYIAICQIKKSIFSFHTKKTEI